MSVYQNQPSVSVDHRSEYETQKQHIIGRANHIEETHCFSLSFVQCEIDSHEDAKYHSQKQYGSSHCRIAKGTLICHMVGTPLFHMQMQPYTIPSISSNEIGDCAYLAWTPVLFFPCTSGMTSLEYCRSFLRVLSFFLSLSLSLSLSPLSTQAKWQLCDFMLYDIVGYGIELIVDTLWKSMSQYKWNDSQRFSKSSMPSVWHTEVGWWNSLASSLPWHLPPPWLIRRCCAAALTAWTCGRPTPGVTGNPHFW